MKQTKRALGRLINEDQLQKLKNDYMLAMKSWAEKEMEKEIASMEAQEHIYELEKSIMTSEIKDKTRNNRFPAVRDAEAPTGICTESN
ncbi:hypothetical protein OUZ56_012487 [Daphnia magna]|uniref:Uncharacterized protein n=1 Tax=Daphnia magna TaxID=35525 RepID=A0ABQ9Z358_9CRUS|nr:hypothetical protein OUZ56_012487 [Daphnia magna]